MSTLRLVCAVVFASCQLMSGHGQQALPALSAAMEEFVERYNSSAAAAYVANAGGICSAGSAGYAQGEGGPAFDLGGRVHMGSNTKSMTAVLVGVLLEKNQVRGQTAGWNTTMADVFPDCASDTAYATVTLAALAAHFSGLDAGTDFWSYHDASPPESLFQQRQRMTADAFATTPVNPVMTTFLYSNWGLIVLGHVAEVSLGMEWEDAMLQHLLLPFLWIC
jgi:CubicO group peptidase (beta-lactamase class C family)